MRRYRPPSPQTVERVRGLISRTSLRRAARTLDLAEVTVASLAAGLNNVTPETERQAETRLSALEAAQTA
ncbi:MAG: hypothetical protein JW940_00470 [Polyangiaceae bacterium]|nr:hypothetical protein [Polyangiaceae bacterium]